MSKKKEYAKKFITEALALNKMEVFDEILHPEYYSDDHVFEKDLMWNRHTSYIRYISGRSKTAKHQLDPDSGKPLVSGIEPAKARMNKNFDPENFPIPDYTIEIHSIVEEGEKVIIMYTQSFVHDKNYHGINPTNQKIVNNATFLFTFLEEKIVKVIFLVDSYQMLANMGDVILAKGDEEQVQQYLAMLERNNLLPSQDVNQ